MVGTVQRMANQAAGQAEVFLRRVVPPGSGGRRLLSDVYRRLPISLRQDPISALAEAIGEARPDAFFIQIGAHDGTQLDPLNDQIERRAWRGLMMEPVPYVFERLQARHASNPRIVLENAALASSDDCRTLYYLPESSDPGLPTWYDALASFRRDVLLKHATWIPDIEERVSEITVACMTFDSLCQKHGVERVDIVQIDTEGYDFEVIKLIDLERYRPTLVMSEHIHLDPETLDACLGHMSRYGYEHFRGDLDMVFLRVGDLGPRDRYIERLWSVLQSRSGSKGGRVAG
jgi:FkbM family methyltransferase